MNNERVSVLMRCGRAALLLSARRAPPSDAEATAAAAADAAAIRGNNIRGRIQVNQTVGTLAASPPSTHVWIRSIARLCAGSVPFLTAVMDRHRQPRVD